MISRRHLRIKAVQGLYAFFQSGSHDLGQSEKQFLKSIDQIYDLFIYHLSFIEEIFYFAEKKIEEGRNKLRPSREDLNPNTRFIENAFYNQLKNNEIFQKQKQKLHISWENEPELIRKAYLKVRDSQLYKKYMEARFTGFHEDLEIVRKLNRKLFLHNDALLSLYEEMNIHWVDDIDIVEFMINKWIKFMQESPDKDETIYSLPSLLKPVKDDYGRNEDRQFVIDLYRNTIVHSDEFIGMIERRANNWEIDRIAIMDILILKMAIAELMYMDSIPLKVTLNEYIDLSKMFSTPKSSVFINGMLDRLIQELTEEGKIKKKGRGLQEK